LPQHVVAQDDRLLFHGLVSSLLRLSLAAMMRACSHSGSLRMSALYWRHQASKPRMSRTSRMHMSSTAASLSSSSEGDVIIEIIGRRVVAVPLLASVLAAVEHHELAVKALHDDFGAIAILP